MTLSVPADWSVIRERPPLLAAIYSGDGVVAVWRYGRRARPPSTRPELVLARKALIAAVLARQPTVRLLSTRILKLDHRPAIELDALEWIGAAPRHVRSTHIYARHAEVVLDEYAPASVFRRVDRQVFLPLRRSLVLGRK